MSLHRTDIIRITRRVFPVVDLSMNDRAFAVPSMKWVSGKFAHYHFANRSPYAHERFDCEDLAIEAMMMARKFHSESTKDLVGLACGVCYYEPTIHQTAVQYSITSPEHAIVWFITGKPGEEGVSFFEPQRSNIVHLEHEELLSIRDPWI